MTEMHNEHWMLGEPLIDLCHRASAAIVELYRSEVSPTVTFKADTSPVTAADHRSHRILVEGLQQLTPGWPILSEEQSMPSFKQRRQWQRYWLIDPLDGTREFLRRTGDFTINVALIEQGVAVMGLIAVPLTHAVYLGVPGQGARCFQADGDVQSLSVRPVQPDVVRVLSGGRHRNQALNRCGDQLQRIFGAVEHLKAGSALKFCQLAEGLGDIYPRFSPCCEWDTAAGQALLEAAGGRLVDLHFNPLRYNTQASVYSPHFYALGGQNVDWQAILTPFEGR